MDGVSIISLNGHTPRIDPSAFIAPGSCIIGDVEIGPEASVWYNCVLRGDVNAIRIGARTNIQDGTVIHCDSDKGGMVGFPTIIEEGALIGHMAMLHGCTVGDGSLIGIGATVLNGAVIGRGCLVGAGALVTEGKTFADHCLILGSPARVVRELSAGQVQGLLRSAALYVQRSRLYRDTLKAPAGSA